MKTSSLILALVAVLVFLLTSGCSRTSVRHQLEQVRTIDKSPKVVADYQPWFGDPQHMNVGYSTQDPGVLRQQIQKAKELGIYAFAVDWYGERRPFLDRSYAVLQRVAAESNFHVALMYDETEKITDMPPKTQWRPWIRLIEPISVPMPSAAGRILRTKGDR